MINELCRLCGNKNSEMLNIFSEIGTEQKLRVKIEEVVRLNIEKEDPLPNWICVSCIKHLESACYFISYCHQTQIFLKELCQGNNPLECSKNIHNNAVDLVDEFAENKVKEEFSRSTLNYFSSSVENSVHVNSTASLKSKHNSNFRKKSDESETNSCNNERISVISQRNNIISTNRIHLKRKCSSASNGMNDESETAFENEDTHTFDKNSDSEENDESDEIFELEIDYDCSGKDFKLSSRKQNKNTKKIRPMKINSSRKSLRKKRIQDDAANSEKTCDKTISDECINDIRKESKEKKRLSCDTCKMKFTQELTYQEHLNVHTGNRPFSCKLCEASFRKRQELNQHLRTIHSEKQFKCSLCDHIAKHKGKLTEHMKSVHEKPFACDLCNYRTGEKGKIKQHIANKHSDDLSYVCEICGNGFKTKTSLQNHRQNIHFPEPKVCQTCGTVCPSLAKYSAHIFRCGKEKKRFPCDKCGNTYVNKEILKDHMNKHLNIRPYKCEVCGKEFFQRNRLDTHKYVHRGAVYSCEICHHVFNRKDNMKNHMKKHFYKPMRYDNMIVTAV